MASNHNNAVVRFACVYVSLNLIFNGIESITMSMHQTMDLTMHLTNIRLSSQSTKKTFCGQNLEMIQLNSGRVFLDRFFFLFV